MNSDGEGDDDEEDSEVDDDEENWPLKAFAKNCTHTNNLKIKNWNL